MPALSRPKDGVLSHAYSRPKDGVLSHAYVAGIHVLKHVQIQTWTAGTSPAMTKNVTQSALS
jgi:hypothetical protein